MLLQKEKDLVRKMTLDFNNEFKQHVSNFDESLNQLLKVEFDSSLKQLLDKRRSKDDITMGNFMKVGLKTSCSLIIEILTF
jgi:hypothetical protein